MKKLISCGVIVTNTNDILLGHVTGQDAWDIPKGMPIEGETFFNAAIRELKEETGLILDSSIFNILGTFAYSNKKNLFLLSYITNELPELDKMMCNSYFISEKNGVKNELVEIDDFKYVPWTEMQQFVRKSMFNVLSGIYYRCIKR
jgi:ADP-ribose pyrophosphatase YjhB (NUDIX family)